MSEPAPAQAAKSMYFELGGPGIASFNFDFRFGKRQDGLGGRVGFGGFYVDGSGAAYFSGWIKLPPWKRWKELF